MKTTIISLLMVIFCSIGGWLAMVELHSTAIPEVPVISDPNIEEKNSREVHGIGYVEPVGEVRKLGFKTSGQIATCRVKLGDEIKANEIIMTLDASVLLQELAVSQAELAVAIADGTRLVRGMDEHQIAAAEHRITFWKSKAAYWNNELARKTSKIGGNEAPFSDSEIRENRMQLETALAEIKTHEAEYAHLKNFVLPEDRNQAKSKVELARARIKLLEQKIADTALCAPFDGTVLEILKREGEIYTLEDAQPVLLFADLNQLQVRAEVEERFIQLLSIGQSVTIYGRNLDETYKGRLAFLKPIMGEKTVFARTSVERKDLDVVQVFIQPSSRFLFPIGMRIDVAIEIDNSSKSSLELVQP